MCKELLLACATALAAVLLGWYAIAQSAAPEEPVIHITARRFNYVPGEVKLTKGVPVILELTSEDVLMGLNIPDFNVRAEIVPGKMTRVRVVPDKTGTFVFLCDIFCGVGHEEMNGKLIVVE